MADKPTFFCNPELTDHEVTRNVKMMEGKKQQLFKIPQPPNHKATQGAFEMNEHEAIQRSWENNDQP